jgi:Phage integrase family
MTILDAMHDPQLFGPWFRDRASWRAWEVFLSALFGLPLKGKDAALYARHTGRTAAPRQPAREAWVIVGRRGGKSRIAALVALYLACFRDYRDKLAPGEVGTLPVIAADRRQARTVMRYITGFLDEVPMLRELVANLAKETIELTNRVTIEVHTASFRAVRGYSLIGVVCDEIAFWQTDDGAVNPDSEILNGLRPGMATVPGAVLLAISSPYARRGALWEAYRRHYAQDGDPVLVWQSDTRSMNPAVDPALIADAYAADEAAAAAEYGAEFRRDIESFVSREAIDAVVVAGRGELPHVVGRQYVAFVDPSGGSQDSMTLAIAHRAIGGPVLDAVRECRPPFSPAEVVEEFVALLRAYRVSTVTGDRYAGEWPREAFRTHGIRYEPAETTKSEYYGALLPPGTNHLDGHNFVRRVFKPAVERAGIVDFHWHDLRHTFASRLAMSRVELATIKELMNHRSISQTTRYAHLSPGHQREAVQRLNGFGKKAPTGTKTGTGSGQGNGEAS